MCRGRERKHHGGQSPREKLSWIITNADHLNRRFQRTPGVVDIMPSIANHLGITIPDAVAKEMDGVPFIGQVDFSDLKAEMREGKIFLRWTSLRNDNSRAEVFITQTNNFRAGGEDVYRKAGDAEIAAGTLPSMGPLTGLFTRYC